MCGIFGYVGTRAAAPRLIEGLRTLEYRGYDSAGIYVPGQPVVKAVGPIDNLAAQVPVAMPGTSGIAHTRWATHGPPTEANAHPHHGTSHIWLVHNGIIENYRELKTELEANGVAFYSDTDSEVLAVLIETHYQGNLLAAVQTALGRVRGTYGLAVMHQEHPEAIIVARLGSPIVLGLGSDGNFVSSDPSALLAHTKDVVYLEDGEIARITSDSYEVSDIAGVKRQKETHRLQWDAEQVQKEGFEHFMLKEIHEAPQVVRNTIRGRLIPEEGRAKLGGLEEVLNQVVNLNRLTITACGSAYLAGHVGKYMLEAYAGLPTDIELASEYRYKTNLPDTNSALLAVTQSGETADTLAAIRLAKKMNLLTLGMVNVVGSTIARETDAGVYNHAGPEIAVASTKAVISQLTAFVLMTLLIGREKGMSQETGAEIVAALEALPAILEQVLTTAPEIAVLAQKYAHYHDAMFIGRTFHAPIAYEGALKLKEISYLHAEAYPGGELKHGSIAMLDEQFPVIALAPEDDVYEKMISNIEEVKARSVPVLAFTTEGEKQLANLADDVLYIPKVHPIVQPIVTTVPLHLFAYYVGVARNINVDRPRNLAKSVTVE